MDGSDVIVLAVMVILGVGAIAAAQRWGTRRGRLLFAYDATPLTPAAASVSDLVQVTFRGFHVPQPHLVTVRLVNIGPRDIASAHFDKGSSLRVDLGCRLFGVVKTSHPARTVSGPVDSLDPLQLEPGLLRRREEVVVEAIVSGEPQPSLVSPLIDVDVIDGDAFDWREDLAHTLRESLLLTLPFGRLSLPLVDAVVNGALRRRPRQ